MKTGWISHRSAAGRGRVRHRLTGLDATPVLFLLCILAACGTRPQLRPLDAPYVPTPDAIGVEMLRLAGVTAADTVYDLGSGDGRVVIAAARDFGARGVGVELDASLVHQSDENAVRAGVADRVSFLWQDLFAHDLRPASVVTLYLFQEVNLKLRPKLLRELRPGTRVVSHDYDMGEWRADHTVRVRSSERVHVLYFWVVPADVDGTWRLQVDGGNVDSSVLRLNQRFQHLTGTLSADDREIPIADAMLRGAQLEFVVRPGPSNPVTAMYFAGRFAGDTITGRVRVDSNGTGRTVEWRAVRIG